MFSMGLWDFFLIKHKVSFNVQISIEKKREMSCITFSKCPTFLQISIDYKAIHHMTKNT